MHIVENLRFVGGRPHQRNPHFAAIQYVVDEPVHVRGYVVDLGDTDAFDLVLQPQRALVHQRHQAIAEDQQVIAPIPIP